MLAPIVQPALSSNAATDISSNVIPHILTIVQHMQQLMVHMKFDQGLGGVCNTYRKICHPLAWQAATNPRQGQPHILLPYFAINY